ncbi:MAG TPA: hypothetical protein VLN61_09985 [Pseudolabrys sp.]|nr:hypothetical protein [Pseudolabrys sp.]
MRKIVILAGLLIGAALFTDTPAKAWVGCGCYKLGAAPVCMPGVLECTGMGGVCLLPCDYQTPKVHKHRHHKKNKK